MKNTYIEVSEKGNSIKPIGRIAYLDALKTFAILLVVEGHVRILGMGLSPYDSLSGMMFNSFEIPIFFFVSGYLAYKKELTYWAACFNLKNKIILLILPAIIFRTVLNIIEHNNLLSPLFEGFGKYWFTVTLFECFLVYYVLLCLIKRNLFVYALMIIISMIGIAIFSSIGHIGPRIIDVSHFSRYFYFFTIGIFARKYQSNYQKLIYNQTVRATVIICFFLILFLLGYDFWTKPLFHIFRGVVLRVFGTFLVISLFASHESFIKESRRLSFLITEIGKRTLPIYVLQYFFIPNFDSIHGWIVGMDMFTIHLMSFGYAIFIIATCLLVLYLLEQSNFIKKYFIGQK